MPLFCNIYLDHKTSLVANLVWLGVACKDVVFGLSYTN